MRRQSSLLRQTLVLAIALLFGRTAITQADGPAWWVARGVLITNAIPNDFAAVTQGQVKNIASNAWAEMDDDLPGGASSAITALVGGFSPTNDYLAANIGQLKIVAQPFYDRLIAAGYTNAYPWAESATTNDYAAANIGQLKNLFSWDLTYSTVGDGIPDWWRGEYFGATTTNYLSCASCDPTGDGISNLQKYQNSLNPFVSYSITAPPAVISYSTGNPAFVPDLGPGASYSWSITNGTITSSANAASITWTAGDAGSATLSVAMQPTNALGSPLTPNTQIPVLACSGDLVMTVPSVVYQGSLSNAASLPALTILTNFEDTTVGVEPYGGLVVDTNNYGHGSGTYFYGATSDHLYALNSSGTIVWSYELSGLNGIGSPISATLGSVGSGSGQILLGVTGGYGGQAFGDGPCGENGCGSLFVVNLNAAVYAIHQFDGADGYSPQGPLMGASDGHFYGTTTYGGANDAGVVYRVDNNGSFSVVYPFTGGADGAYPYDGLIQGTGTDHNLYGTTSAGGAHGGGTIFEIAPSGVSTTVTLLSFNGTDGSGPITGLLHGNGSLLYGTTESGGTHGYGTVFQIATNGTSFVSLYSFTNGLDGAYPTARLMQAADGYFYGTTMGTTGSGTVFRISSTGSFSVVGPCPNNGYLASELVQAPNGLLYGTTTYGGGGGVQGNIYSINPIDVASYTWSVSNGTVVAGQNTPNLIWTAGNAGTAAVSVTITNATGCISSTTNTVTVKPAYYIDYAGGTDTVDNGTNALTPWKHCPGDPNAGFGPGRTNIPPGTTVFFKGGVQYILANSPSFNSSVGWVGIQLSCGGVTNPVIYDGNSAGLWGTGKAIITDNYGNGGSNSFIAFGPANGNRLATLTNIIIKGFQIGPLGGASNLPPYTETSLTTATLGTTNGSYTVYISYDPNINEQAPFQTGYQLFQVYNQASFGIQCTNVTFSNPLWTWGGPRNGSPSLPITINSGSITTLQVNTAMTNVYGAFTGAAFLWLNNGQVLTNLMTTRVTPLSYAWGFDTWGPVTNVQFVSDLFTNIGYWQNVQPIGLNSLAGQGIYTAGFEGDGYLSGIVVSNCEFTHTYQALDLGYNSLSNVTITASTFHDYLVWGIAFAPDAPLPEAAFTDAISVHDNTFYNLGYAYGVGFGTYYGVSNTVYHQDPIIGFLATPCAFGPNVNIYRNTFYDQYPEGSSGTASIFLDGGFSANIYNNLFNCPLVDLDGRIQINEEGSGSSDPNTNNPVYYGIYNNTFISFATNGCWLSLGSTSAYTNQGVSEWWPTNHIVTALNNIGYDFDTNADFHTMMQFSFIGNTGVCSNWVIDYNDWYSSYAEWFRFNYGLANNGLPTNWFNVSGKIAALQTNFPWESHTVTSAPLFVNIAYGASTNSAMNDYAITNGPTVGAGTNLSGLNLPSLNADINGNPRPSNSNWDIGAYQH